MRKDPYDVLLSAMARTGWVETTLLYVVSRFIEGLGLEERFERYIEGVIETEERLTEEDDEDDEDEDETTGEDETNMNHPYTNAEVIEGREEAMREEMRQEINAELDADATREEMEAEMRQEINAELDTEDDA